MLEIRYNANTKELTGWWGDRHGNHEAKLKGRPDEAIIILDIPIPEKPLSAYLFDEASQSLVPNPNWIDPDLPSVDELRACELLSQSPPVITMPDIWELLRIIGKRLGYRFEE